VLVRRLAVRVLLVGSEVRDGQQVDVDAVGYQAGAVPPYLLARPQVGNIADAQPTQLVATVIAELAQFAGPEQPSRPQHTGAVGDVTKVPGPLQIPYAGSHVR